MKIAFFPSCMVDMFYPEVGMAAVRVLERLGCEIVLPDEQICCGQPLFNSGFGKQAEPMMKKIIDAYQGFDTIVALSGSCARKCSARWKPGPITSAAPTRHAL